MRRVTQKDISRRAGVDRSTVSKILNGYPHDTFGEAAKEKVFSAAASLGYLHPAVVKPHRRKSERNKMAKDILVKILSGKKVFPETHKARTLDISSGGVSISFLGNAKRIFPCRPFQLKILFPETNITVKAIPLRFLQQGKRLGMAAEFTEPVDIEKLN